MQWKLLCVPHLMNPFYFWSASDRAFVCRQYISVVNTTFELVESSSFFCKSYINRVSQLERKDKKWTYTTSERTWRVSMMLVTVPVLSLVIDMVTWLIWHRVPYFFPPSYLLYLLLPDSEQSYIESLLRYLEWPFTTSVTLVVLTDQTLRSST